MTHVFITVGTGGPENPVHQAIVRSIKELAPSRVTFLCSAKTAKETLPLVLEQLGKQPPPHVVHTSGDPDNIARLTREYADLLDDAKTNEPGLKVHADFTSGTKAMSAAICVAVVTTEASGLHYAIGPRDKSGRAVSTEKILSLDTGSMLAERSLPEMTNLFHIGAFEAVHKWAQTSAAGLDEGKLHSRVESLSRLSACYAKWDRFDYPGAADAMRQCLGRKSLPTMTAAGWKEPALQGTLEHLEACKTAAAKKIPDKALLLDIVANAHRCFKAKRFDDAVARGYRIAEALGQFLLHRDCGISDSGKAPLSTIEKLAPNLAGTLRSRGGVAELDRGNALKLLKEAGHQIGTNLAEDTDLENTLKGRNQSLLAHGFIPVTEANARKLLDLLAKHLRTVVGQTTQAELAAADFMRCPWADKKLDAWDSLTIG